MPAVAQAGGAPHGRVGVAADPHRDAVRLHRLGERVHGAHADVTAAEGDGVGRPCLPHAREVLVGHRPALLERRRTERLEFLAQPAHPGAEDDAAAGEPVERGQHLGGHQWVAIGHHQDTGAEPRAAGRPRQRAEQRQRLQIILGGAARQLPRRRVRIDGARHRGGQHDVIGDEDRRIPERVGPRGHRQDLIGFGQGAAAGKRDAELHDSSGKRTLDDARS